MDCDWFLNYTDAAPTVLKDLPPVPTAHRQRFQIKNLLDRNLNPK
jgi:uncharacterized membrane protein